MRSPIYANDHKLLNIGHRLESNVQPVIFDISTWISLHGDGGTVSLIIKRAGEDQQYLGTIRRDGSKVIWVPNAADTGRTGFGEVELRYVIDDESNALSRIWETNVCRSLEATADAPDPYEAFAADIAKAAQDAKDSADRAGHAQKSIENMTVSAHEADSVSVQKTVVDDHVNLDFGIPSANVTKEAIEKAVGGAVAKADLVNASFNSMKHYIDTEDAKKADKADLESTKDRVEQVRSDAIGGLDNLSNRIDLDWSDTEAHINNTDVHVSADEKNAWNSKADGADLVDVKTAIDQLTEKVNDLYDDYLEASEVIGE